MPTKSEEAILIFLDGAGLADSVYRSSDLSTLEDLLIARLEKEGIGILDGHEIGPTETVIYLYGASAEKMFAEIKPILEKYPLCQNSKVVVRHGGPGANQRVVSLPTASGGGKGTGS